MAGKRSYLQKLVSDKAVLQACVESRQLGLGTGNSRLNQQGVQLPLHSRRGRSQGKRIKGAGRKDRFAHVKQKVKHFV